MVNYEINWENDGAVEMKNPKTINRYHELCEQWSKFDCEKVGMFWAFDQKQFDEAHNRLVKKGIIGESDQVFKGPAGAFGTIKAFKAWIEAHKEFKKSVKEECDPQEVYFYEFNNHESQIDYEGDLSAIQLIADFYGVDVAKTIKRRRNFYTIDEIMSGKPLK